MNTKKIVWILVGVIFISFGIGIFSLRYNEEVNLSWIKNNKINIQSNDAQVDVKDGRIDIKDGNSHVQVGWDGINIKDGNDHVVVDWNGIDIKEGGRFSFNIFKRNNWLKNPFNKTVFSTVNEENFLDMKDIKKVEISSSFVDVKVIQEDRNDTWIRYYGEMKSDIVPILKVENKDGKGLIKLENPKGNYTVTSSNVILEIFIPQNYNNDMIISSSSGGFDLRDLNLNNISLITNSGDIEMENIKSNKIKSKASSGDIEIKSSTGNLELSSSSGDMVINSTKDTGDMNLATSSGDILFNFHNEASYTINAMTGSGDYIYDIPINILKNLGKGFEGVLENGDRDINIVTSSGDVIFQRYSLD